MHPFWPILLAALPFAGRDGLPEQRALERALREAVAAACPSATLAIDPDLTRAALAFVNAVRAGRAPVSGSALAFYAAIESYEPSAAAGIAKVSPAANADRAVGDLFSRECRFNRAGVAAAPLAGKEAVVALLTAAHATELNALPGQVQPGTALEIDATLAPGLSAPRLFLLRPGGVVEEQHVSTDGRRLRGTLQPDDSRRMPIITPPSANRSGDDGPTAVGGICPARSSEDRAGTAGRLSPQISELQSASSSLTAELAGAPGKVDGRGLLQIRLSGAAPCGFQR